MFDATDKLRNERWDYIARIGQVINLAQGGGDVVQATIHADIQRPGVFIRTSEEYNRMGTETPSKQTILIRLEPEQARRYAYAILSQLAESEAPNTAPLIKP